jgi:hypothetical protein
MNEVLREVDAVGDRLAVAVEEDDGASVVIARRELEGMDRSAVGRSEGEHRRAGGDDRRRVAGSRVEERAVAEAGHRAEGGVEEDGGGEEEEHEGTA